MSDWMPETKSAWRKLKWNLRALLCEMLTGWALKVCPKGYTPAMIDGAIEGVREYDRKKTLPTGSR